jgi:hypothetical protein
MERSNDREKNRITKERQKKSRQSTMNLNGRDIQFNGCFIFKMFSKEAV